MHISQVKVKSRNRLLLTALTVGVSLGCFWLISPGCLFMLSLVIFTGFMLWRFSDQKDRRFVMAIFIIGIASRIIVYLLIAILSGKVSWLMGDSRGIHNYAWAWAQQVRDPTKTLCLQEGKNGQLYFNPYPLVHHVGSYGFSGFTYLLGAVYYFFGSLRFSARLFNCLMGVGTGILIYYIAKDIFGKECAKLSAILTIFIPSLFLWSLAFLKDIPFIFLGCIMIWSFLRFQKTKRLLFLSILFLAILAQGTIRPAFSTVFIILTFILSYFIVSRINWKKKIIIPLCLLILVIPFSQKINVGKRLNSQMYNILSYTQGVVNTGGTTYKVFPDKYYNDPLGNGFNYITYSDFIRGIFKGWVYLLLAPFPWKAYTGLQLMSYPQMILWYLCIPFIFIGMIISLRYKWRESFVIFSYIIVLGSIVALHSGNIGTLFRHRDILTPLFLIFASLGLIKTFGRLDNF